MNVGLIHAGTATRVVPGQTVTIGRSIDCELRFFEDTGVTRRHCAIGNDGVVVSIEDLGSKNGTIVNGTRITDRVPLHDGDVIIVGEQELTVAIEGAVALDDTAEFTNQR